MHPRLEASKPAMLSCISRCRSAHGTFGIWARIFWALWNRDR